LSAGLLFTPCNVDHIKEENYECGPLHEISQNDNFSQGYMLVSNLQFSLFMTLEIEIASQTGSRIGYRKSNNLALGK
jgi:NADH:ubiquinone oxidoreductase subunit 3 (subunit A)